MLPPSEAVPSVGRYPGAVLERDVATRIDLDAAGCCGVAAVRGQPARYRDILAADDPHRVTIGERRCRSVQALDVHQRAEFDPRRSARGDVGARADLHTRGGQIHRACGAHPAFDGDQSGFGQGYPPLERRGERRVVDPPGAVDELVHEAGGGRGHGEAAHVDLATGADHHTVRIEEEDIAADATVLVGIHHAVERAALVAHQVEQVLSCRRADG